jgi:predicted ArsR family transcriptional regulator
MALNPLDWNVLKTAFQMSNRADDALNSEAVRSKLQGLGEDQFYESLEIMEASGLVQRSREIAARPPYFFLKSRGIVELLDKDGIRQEIQTAVEKAIVSKTDSTLTDIAATVGQSPIVVQAIMETLENQGDIDIQRGLGAEPRIGRIHATLRRRVGESG